MRILYLLCLFILACSTPKRPKALAQAERIQWQTFGQESFARAKSQNKLIFMDIGIEGCTACRWMYEDTLQNSEVVSLLNTHFISIQIDAEANPDLGERYERWAWPALIFLNENAEQVLAIRGNKRPHNFVPILKSLQRAHDKGELQRKIVASPNHQAPSSLQNIIEEVEAQLARQNALETHHTQRNDSQKIYRIEQNRLQFEFLRAYQKDESFNDALERLLVYQKLIDPIWGGVFVAAIGTWENYIPEKRIAGQATALFDFANAYQATGELRWKQGIEALDRYLRSEHMYSKEGTFFTSQQDEAPGLTPELDAQAYYALNDAERRRYGLPPVDRAVYTDKNALIIQAYLKAYEATAQRQYFVVAQRAVQALLRRRFKKGHILQFTPNDIALKHRLRGAGSPNDIYLLSQSEFGLALLSMFHATQDIDYLHKAKLLAHVMTTQLKGSRGIFLASSATPPAGLPALEPFSANCAAAHFLAKLSAYSGKTNYRNQARTLLENLSTRFQPSKMGSQATRFAIAAMWAEHGGVQYTLVGDSQAPEAQALLAAAKAVYAPLKALRPNIESKYPPGLSPALYICDDRACSVPLQRPQDIALEAQKFR